MRTFHVIVPFILLAASSCTENTVIPEETQLVIQAYLYVGELVSEIYVGRSNLIGSADTTNRPVTTATVSLTKNGVSYTLTADSSRPGFYRYVQNDLAVNPGDRYNLTVNDGGTIATAETSVPVLPDSVSITTRTVRFTTETISTPFGDRTRIVMSDTVYIEWRNGSEQYHYINVRSVDPLRTEISSDTLQFRNRFFVSRPTTQSYHWLRENELGYTGRYVATIYRVNKEYADLYRSREPDSRDLAEPLTNIRNGLGVFSAFSSDTVSFTVVKQ